MPTFGLITEGITDQQVLQAILDGFFDPAEIDTRPFLPISDNTHRHQVQNFSNWELVLEYCASPKFAEAFPFVDYVVVQIDTDQCEAPSFGVPRYENEHRLSPEEIIPRVVAKLIARIGDTVWEAYQNRIIFAIAVEMTECWLLPLYATESKDKRRHLNCLKVLNRCLTKKNLHAINPEDKKPDYYNKLADRLAKRKELMKHCHANPSLAIFIDHLNALFPTNPEEPA